jgi:hypothetical protein
VNRSWLAFTAGVCLMLTPLRELWLWPALGPWGPFAAGAVLVVIAWWSAREPPRSGRA